uniref:Ig-like domain-containing protein n=1 Tax=Arion vulgaris TaxID=1028688 RepID=A0A0B7BH26_9EUPU
MLQIVFSCMGTQIPPTSVEVKDVTHIDPDLMEAEIEITRADLQNYESHGTFWCECSAVDIDGQLAVTSRKGFVSNSQLKTKFGVEPTSTTALEGDDVEFACEAPEGQPKPEIMWRKDKKRLEVENNPRFSVTEKGSLVIHSVNLQDKGMYQCVARNIAGRRESLEAMLAVTAQSSEPTEEVSEDGDFDRKVHGVGKLRATRQSIKTYFTSEPLDKYFVTADKTLLIDCGVVAADILTFRCNGKRMDRTRQTINQGLDATGNRVIQSQLSVTYDDVQKFLTESGEDQSFQCVCAAWFQDTGSPNGWGRLDSSAALGFVHLAHLDEAFLIEPSDVVAGLNSDATVICEPPKGEPNPWVHWYKDSNRLDPRSSEKYSVNSKGHLTVHNVQYEDAGLYNCLAGNVVTSVQSRAGRLTVTAEAAVITTAKPEDAFPTFPAVIPSTPVFLRDLEAEYTLDEDGTKTIVCAVVSADQLSIDCAGQRLGTADYELKSEIHRETEKRLLYATTVITAEKVKSHKEEYFCQCTAWYLNEQKTWERLTSSKGYIRKATTTAYIGNEFVSAPVHTEAVFESEAKLVCIPPAGNPTPQVHWLKDGARINFTGDPNFVLLETRILFIEFVRITDEGEYICVAENEAGVRQTQPVQLTVLGKPETLDETTTEIAETDTTAPESEVTATEDLDGATRSDLQEPSFAMDLDMDYYIFDNRPAILTCTIIAAKTLVIVCNGEVLKESLRTGYHYVHPYTNQTLRDNSLSINITKFQEYTGSEPYTCFCRAYYQKEGSPTGELLPFNGEPAVIHIGYLEDTFFEEPSDRPVVLMGRVELPCIPPEGKPEPEISWTKDDFPVVENERITIGDNGSLIIAEFEEEDEGSYICVANNSVIVRSSKPAFISLVVTAGEWEQSTKPYIKPDLETDETTSLETESLFSGNPYISKDLHSVYYLVKNKPVTITCEAYSVEFITFTCGMQNVNEVETRVREEELSLHDGKISLVKVVEASVNVSKSDVENTETDKEYFCQCHAHYYVPGVREDQKLNSEKGAVTIAYLKKNFQKPPENQTVTEGSSLNIFCQPPLGNPMPKVTWTKNGEEIEALSITPSGILIYPEAQFEHSGVYICIAENEAGKRMSDPVTVEVKTKDGVSPIRGDTEENIDAETEKDSEGNIEPKKMIDSETDVETNIDNSEKIIDVETEDDSKENIDKSEIDSETDEVTEGITESSLNVDTQESIENEKSKESSEENMDGEIKNLDIEVTEWIYNEKGPEKPEHEKENVDYNFEAGKTSDEKIDYGGRTVETKNNMEEYDERDGTINIYEGQDVYEGRYETIDKKEDGNINDIGRRKKTTKTCPKLAECKVISAQMPANVMDKSNPSVHDLCDDVNALLQCVDQNLAECNTTMSSPHEGASLYDISNWFTQYCNRLILNSKSMDTCFEINKCDLQIETVATDNSTYWCSLVNSLVNCTHMTINNCGLDELVNDLNILESQTSEIYCSNGKHFPEITPEPESTSESNEVDTEQTGEAETTESTGGDIGDGDNGDGENNENTEAGAKGKHKGGDTDDGDKDFTNTAGNEDHDDADEDNEENEDHEEAESKIEDIFTKEREKFSKHNDINEEEDDSTEDNFNEIDEMNSAKKMEKDPFAEIERQGVEYEKSEEEDDHLSKDDIYKKSTENEDEDSANQVGDGDSANQVEDGDQEETKPPVVEASQKGNGSAVLKTSILLATILQLVMAVSLSCR